MLREILVQMVVHSTRKSTSISLRTSSSAQVKRGLLTDVRREMQREIAKSRELRAVPLLVDALRQELSDNQSLGLAKLEMKLEGIHEQILPDLRQNVDDQLRVAHQLHRDSLASMQKRHWEGVVKASREAGGSAGKGASASAGASYEPASSDENGEGDRIRGNDGAPVGGLDQNHHPVMLRQDLEMAHARLDGDQDTLRGMLLDLEAVRADVLKMKKAAGGGLGASEARGGSLGVGLGGGSRGLRSLPLELREEVRRIATQAVEARLAPMEAADSGDAGVYQDPLPPPERENNLRSSSPSGPKKPANKTVSLSPPASVGQNSRRRQNSASRRRPGLPSTDLAELRRQLMPMIANDVRNHIGVMQFRSAGASNQNSKTTVSKAGTGIDGNNVDDEVAEGRENVAGGALGVNSTDSWTLGDLREELFDVTTNVSELVDALKDGGMLHTFFPPGVPSSTFFIYVLARISDVSYLRSDGSHVNYVIM